MGSQPQISSETPKPQSRLRTVALAALLILSLLLLGAVVVGIAVFALPDRRSSAPVDASHWV